MTAITLGPVAQTARTHTSRSGQLFAAVVLAAMLLGLSAGTAAAQDYPPGNITVGTPNATITISGTDWGAGTTVEVVYEDGSGATATATGIVESDGTFAAQLALPNDAALGHAAATVRGTGEDGQPREESQRVFVQEELADAAGDASPSDDAREVALGSPSGGSTAGGSGPDVVVPAGDLPTTGGVSLGITAVALALLAAGGAALTVARRRQRSS